jgi:hypothetical protein
MFYEVLLQGGVIKIDIYKNFLLSMHYEQGTDEHIESQKADAWPCPRW